MDPRMKNLIEVSVDSIRIHMPTAQHLVILKEKEADRYLPIWIGSFEADAIALAVRVECPIFVASEVMETAGIIPEADEAEGDKDKVETVVDEERLAVFRDFVNSLDLPELPDEPGTKDEPGAQDRPGGRPGRG